VSTGHIKAIANYPETYNHAVATLYEPGSTFKLASVMAGLEDGYLHAGDSIDTGGGEYNFFDRTMRDVHGYGRLSLRQCFEKSSNIGIAKLVYKHYKNRPEQFISRLDQLGVLGGTGFALRGEPAPYIIRPKDKEWSGPTLPWLSTGYNVRMTPLQVLAFYNAVANGGRMMQPMLVQALRSGSDEIARFEPVVQREKIASDETLALARELMEGVVERGTSKAIRTEAYPAAGKTGTAQKLIGGEYKRTYRASFAGYFPAQNPRYSCFVMIEEPTEAGYYGGDVAAPVFREIADALYATDITLSRPASELQVASKQLHYPVTRVVHQGDAKTVYNRFSVSAPSSPESEFVRSWQNGPVVRLAPKKLSKVAVPDVQGMSAKDAVAVLENLGLLVRLQGHGKVRRQNIRAGSAFRKGQTITLTLTS
jgi:cell division protein FtsI (penicillin-binding protein 3)